MKQIRLLFTIAFFLVTFASFSQKINPGKVVVIYEVDFTLEVGMTFELLEQMYLKEYVPAIKKNFPGVEFCIMKGERGERTGKYIEFLVFESLDERNKWFPQKRKSSAETKQALNNMREIQDRMVKLYSSVTYTHYVVL